MGLINLKKRDIGTPFRAGRKALDVGEKQA